MARVWIHFAVPPPLSRCFPGAPPGRLACRENGARKGPPLHPRRTSSIGLTWSGFSFASHAAYDTECSGGPLRAPSFPTPLLIACITWRLAATTAIDRQIKHIHSYLNCIEALLRRRPSWNVFSEQVVNSPPIHSGCLRATKERCLLDRLFCLFLAW